MAKYVYIRVQVSTLNHHTLTVAVRYEELCIVTLTAPVVRALIPVSARMPPTSVKLWACVSKIVQTQVSRHR